MLSGQVWRIRVVLGALFLSGVAAIVNQIVWQRALKVYLAGSEAISSMIVVLVFMVGLGVGSFHVGRSAGRIGNPMGRLGVVEVLLLVVNLVICGALGFDVAASANELQRWAAAMGIPLQVVYAGVSAVVLMVPCYLMGVTMPLVSEASQRQLGVRDSGFLTVLFFLNTLGAVAGGLVSGFWLMPYLGQQKSLVLAALLNGVAGALLLGLRAGAVPAAEGGAGGDVRSDVADVGRGVRADDGGRRWVGWVVLGLAFGLGFFALAYEMYLFRVAALAFLPLPYTFAAVLVVYLLMWSLGVFAARFAGVSAGVVLWVTAGVVAFSPQVLYFEFLRGSFAVFLAVQCLPCFGFGLAFGRILAESARSWGNDVGIFYFANTIGSAAGILTAVLVGYRVHPMFMGWSIFVGYVVMAVVVSGRGGLERMGVGRRVVLYGGIVGVVVPWIVSAAWMGNAVRMMKMPDSLDRMYFSPEGVVVVREGRGMFWDGLWHSDLSHGDHVGTNNWLLGVVPWLAHGGENGLETLVVGLGTGITAATLAEIPAVESVDVYEINPSLEQVLKDFPEGTLGVGGDPKVHITWGDGRTGMVLNEKKYDVVTQQPMYLQQAGSSILLSREYMELVKGRLKPGGVFAIYCNSMGNFGQAAVVRRTADMVFDYCESFGDGYMLLVSDSPIVYSREKVAGLIGALPADGVARRELEGYGVDRLVDYLDVPRVNWTASPFIVTDDRPIVEYPEILRRLVPRPREGDGWAR